MYFLPPENEYHTPDVNSRTSPMKYNDYNWYEILMINLIIMVIILKWVMIFNYDHLYDAPDTRKAYGDSIFSKKHLLYMGWFIAALVEVDDASSFIYTYRRHDDVMMIWTVHVPFLYSDSQWLSGKTLNMHKLACSAHVNVQPACAGPVWGKTLNMHKLAPGSLPVQHMSTSSLHALVQFEASAPPYPKCETLSVCLYIEYTCQAKYAWTKILL